MHECGVGGVMGSIGISCSESPVRVCHGWGSKGCCSSKGDVELATSAAAVEVP